MRQIACQAVQIFVIKFWISSDVLRLSSIKVTKDQVLKAHIRSSYAKYTYPLKEKHEAECRESVKERNERNWRDGNDEFRAQESLAIMHKMMRGL
jgi:hypothetical protein